MSVEALARGAVPADEAPERFRELLARAGKEKERIVLTRDGRPYAALVPIDDVEWLERLEDETDARLAEEALREWEAEGRPTIPWNEVRKELGSN